MTLMTSCTKTQRAYENRAYARELLWKREPAFAAELATAEQDFPCPACPSRWCSCSTARRGALLEPRTGRLREETPCPLSSPARQAI
jgi:hypothetical protein